MKRRRNPTLVHHGEARRALWHVIDMNRRPIADLYVRSLMAARRAAARIASAIGRTRLILLDNRHTPRKLAQHPRRIVRRSGLTRARRSRARNPIPRAIDRRSVRTVKRGRTRILVGCPRGRYDAKRKRCRTAMRKIESRNPSPPIGELSRAGRVYRTFHGFGSAAVRSVRTPPRPRTLVRIGELTRIGYMSNKWDGRRRRYVHDTQRPRPVLYSGIDGRSFYILGGNMRVTERGLEH